MSLPRPDSSRDERAGERWVTLEEAATALHLTQQALWHRLHDLRVDVRRIDVGGRQMSGLSRGDLARLAAIGGGERDASHPGHGSSATVLPVAGPSGPTAPAIQGGARDTAGDQGPRSLWTQLREFEKQRDQLDFELRIVRTQLADALARSQRVEESVREARGELERARAEIEFVRAQVDVAQVRLERTVAEREDALSTLTVVERQLSRSTEIESARERYCDRLEQRLRSLGAA